MDSVLFKIQDSVIKYANIISKISKVDVEVMDENYYRVAGTGIFKDKINKDMSLESFVYTNVLKTGETSIVKNPGKEKICEACPNKEDCVETFEISTPINLRGKTIGVIGMMSSDIEHRELILDNLDDYLELLSQIAEFISAKAFEYMETKEIKETVSALEDVTKHLEQGVLIVDDKNTLISINKSAKEQLRLKESILGSKIAIEFTGDVIDDLKEYHVKIANRNYTLIGDLVDLNRKNTRYKKVLIFSDLVSLRNQLNKNITVVNPLAIDQIIGTSEKTMRLKEEILKISKTNSTVLITGESGTGKEMVATAIWKSSNRADKPFVAVNCGAIPEPLLESELFGYVKGAFTGADSKGRIGKFELANNGIIFLDEIGDMPLYLQVKLLRVLQDRKITRIGSNHLIDLDIRVIAATNKNLEKMIEEKKFREDLYYRLNVIPINISPLRERREDILPIIELLIDRYSKLSSKTYRYIDDEAIKALQKYNWPGNVRELENTIEFMINMMESDGVLDLKTIPENILYDEEENQMRDIMRIDELEQREIKKALDIYGHSTEAKNVIAKKLGIGIATLYRKLEKYN
ncbi:MAG: sigma 54-interacting transcriptional regulator [Tissierellia bacterium]|nr:sigma 54-interacting transcriptional regulator [Tissierellia bacterium]